MITKQQISEADGQQLAEWAATELMGWVASNDGFNEVYHDSAGEIEHNWQPHLNTEKGKAQCLQLILDYRLTLTPVYFEATEDAMNCEGVIDKPQIAVLRAALLSKIGNRYE